MMFWFSHRCSFCWQFVFSASERAAEAAAMMRRNGSGSSEKTTSARHNGKFVNSSSLCLVFHQLSLSKFNTLCIPSINDVWLLLLLQLSATQEARDWRDSPGTRSPSGRESEIDGKTGVVSGQRRETPRSTGKAKDGTHWTCALQRIAQEAQSRRHSISDVIIQPSRVSSSPFIIFTVTEC